MKKVSSFMQNKNIVLTYFKINKKLITFFLIFWTAIVGGTFFLTTIGIGGVVIANNSPGSDLTVDGGGHSSSSGGGFALTSIYSVVLNSVGILFYGIISIIFVNKIVIKEVSTTQISMWLTQPISRTQVVMSKLSFILLLITIMYLPTLAIMLSFASQAYDARELFKNVVIMGVQYYLYIILIAILIFVLSLLLVESGTLFTTISALVLIYLAIVGFLGFVIFDMNNEKLKAISFIPKYLGPQVFLTNILESDWSLDPIHHVIKEVESVRPDGRPQVYIETLDITPLKEINWFRLISLDISMFLLNVILAGYANSLFRDKSFNI